MSFFQWISTFLNKIKALLIDFKICDALIDIFDAIVDVLIEF